MEKGYNYLLKNLTDSVYEMMLKLDEEKSNGISVYYTPDLISYLLGEDENSALSKIDGFSEFAKGHIGTISIDHLKDGRIGIKVGRDGIGSIMYANSEKIFLKNLIKKVRDRKSSIQDIKNIFEEESAEYKCIETFGDEFQYVIYFEDSSIDEYKYCFTFDAMGSYYHRFTDYDFDKLASHNE